MGEATTLLSRKEPGSRSGTKRGRRKSMSDEVSKTVEAFRRRAEKERKRMQQQEEKRERREKVRQRKLKKVVYKG